MNHGFDALNERQRSDFEAVHAKFGMAPGQLSHPVPLDTANFGGRLVLSADPNRSHVAPALVPFQSMAHLKSLIGTPDEHYASGRYSDAGIVYPAPIDPDRVAFLRTARTGEVTADEHAALLTAAYAYVQGHSAKLQDFEQLLDAHFAPGALGYIAAETLVVRDGQTVVIPPSGTPLVLNVASVAVYGTGQIQVDSVPLTMIAQALSVQPG